MNIQELQEENEQLHATVIGYETDVTSIVVALHNVMNAIGLDPIKLIESDSPMATLSKTLPALVSDMMIKPKVLELKFQPLKELAPLLTKYEHLIPSKNG